MAQFPDEAGQDGSFQRQPDEFREWVKTEGEFTPEPNRYQLYICKACPWAHRSWIVLRLMGLEHVVGVSVADPIRTDDTGWAFREGDGHGPDLAEGFHFLSEAYRATAPNFSGRVTVPVLWDKQTRRIVNNSEDDICRMWATVFEPLAKHPVDLFPEAIAEEQNALSDLVYEHINNGVYRAGFADKQSAYDQAVTKLFVVLDQLEARLAHGGPYLFGEQTVETDWRLFCTLIRFDAVYHGHFKCNLRRIIDYPHLQDYLERLYRLPSIAETVNFDHIKRHYYVTHDDINPTQIVPLGPKVVIRAEIKNAD
ncbi:glutathione S-transferase family protein [Cerasicoccus arenae]|uniref:Glutathione-dependent reductase n=1 Tax=Cerasicoccus arenae TaxID=424488 RepID=A0A8J3GCK5_9BACT|nr:glutathione S-transferase C-terminal domain-containing protein [Cerasicoccus arenae]MBK1856979.1 glutathione S-transferase C-terminal domain-containing protein [Cerasicoccus arenae]GHB90191.1 glutathione-dependent reductase [Cerasicoccus arenae]